MPSRTTDDKGSAIVGVLVVALLVMSFFLAFFGWTHQRSKSVVHSVQTEKAVYAAESGYYAALDWLKTPAAGVSLSTNPYILNGLTEGSTYMLSLQRSLTDVTLVNIVSTGYYEIPGGPVIDPVGLPSRIGVINAQVRVESIKDYFAAVPGTLSVASGSNITDGKVYGDSLVFMPPAGAAVTRVGAAFYVTNVTDGTSFNPSPSFVTFTQTPNNAQKLPSPLRLPQVTPMRDSYFAMASDPLGPCLLPVTGNTCTLNGSWSVPSNPSGVCFCQGNLYLGSGGNALSVTGNAVVFVEGQTFIEGSVLPVTTADWIAVASESNITIDPNAPDVLEIHGTFVTDGSIVVSGNPRPAGQLTFFGGILAQKTISLSPYLQSRTYGYQAPQSALQLPSVVEPLAWGIAHGNAY